MSQIHITLIMESRKIVKQQNRKEQNDSDQLSSYHINSTQNHKFKIVHSSTSALKSTQKGTKVAHTQIDNKITNTCYSTSTYRVVPLHSRST